MAKQPAKKSSRNTNGKGANTNGAKATKAAATPKENDAGTETGNPELNPEIIAKIAQVRSQVRENFGKVVMAMMMLPRYRNQSIADLNHLVLDPLIRDRIAIAYPGKTEDDQMADITGVAIWASVSDEVDANIREQIKAGTFPLRLKSEDWNSGDNNWLIDVIAPDKKTTATVIANFKQVVKEGGLRLHPLVTRLVDEETLKKMGAARMDGSSEDAAKGDKKPATVN